MHLNQVGFKDRNFIVVGFVGFSIKTNVGFGANNNFTMGFNIFCSMKNFVFNYELSPMHWYRY